MPIFQEPVRRVVRRSGLGNRGYFPSYKTGAIIQWESQRERRCAWLLEYSTAVVHYIQQPLEFEYVDTDGKSRRTIPDYGAELRNGTALLVEVKTEAEAKKPDVKNRLEMRKRAANAAGYLYQVVTDPVLFASVAVKNVENLLFCRPMLYERFEHMSNFHHHCLHGLTLQEAGAILGQKSVMKLLALQVVTTDLKEPISNSSTIRIEQGGSGDILLR